MGQIPYHQIAVLSLIWLTTGCLATASSTPASKFIDDLFLKYGQNESGKIYEEGFMRLTDKLGVGALKLQITDPHGSHESKPRIVTNGHSMTNGHSDHGNTTYLTPLCMSRSALLGLFGLNISSGLNAEDLTKLSPVLLQQITRDACLKRPQKVSFEKPSTLKMYGVATLSVAIISAFAVSGLFLVGFQNKPIYKYLLSGMMALGYSSMVGDACLHLIPEALGFGAKPGDPIPVGPVVVADHIWAMFTFFCTLYGFFIFELISVLFLHRKETKIGHGHSHSPLPLPDHDNIVGTADLHPHPMLQGDDHEMSCEEDKHRAAAYAEGTVQIVLPKEATEVEKEKDHDKQLSSSPQLAWMLLAGDALHNFADGLAIGAAFTISIGSGISTSIAIFCHEIPHEIGDLAAFLSTGMSWKKALMLNIFCAMCCFVGLYLGIAVSQDPSSRTWMFAIAAGMFCYVGLVEMLPELVRHFVVYEDCRPGLFLAENVGIILGITIMLMVAIYEDRINIG